MKICSVSLDRETTFLTLLRNGTNIQGAQPFFLGLFTNRFWCKQFPAAEKNAHLKSIIARAGLDRVHQTVSQTEPLVQTMVEILLASCLARRFLFI